MTDIENKDQTKKAPVKKQKKKSFIRFEAILPVTIIVVLTYLYFHFFFDSNLRRLIEWGGYQAVGAEVNVANVETSFFNASLKIQKIELTNSEAPEYNLFEIGEIRFACLWDALLRAKIVINEAAIENIGIKTKRAHIGKVKPPEPPEEEKPNELAEEGKKVAGKALDNIEDNYEDNILGDLASVSKGTDAQDQLGKIEDSLESKKKMSELEKFTNEKKVYWDAKFKTLPKPQELQALGDRLKKVKTSNFKNVQELQSSLTEIQSVLKEADEKKKLIQSTADELQKDLAYLDKEVKNLDDLVKADIKNIQARMKLPDFNGEKLIKALIYPYIQPYLKQFQRYEALARKYLPPKFTNKQNQDQADVSIQPTPRAKGISYEFGHPNSYPSFWLKRAGISSNANTALNIGTLSGELTHVSSNQVLTGKPTQLLLQGDFPSLDMKDMLLKLVLDQTRPQFKVDFLYQIGSYGLADKTLLKSKDLDIAFNKAVGNLKLVGLFKQAEGVKIDINNEFSQINYAIDSKSKELKSFMESAFTSIPMFNFDVHAEGKFPKLAIDFKSNIGKELEKAFNREINAKIEQAKKQVQEYVNKQIGEQKKKIEDQVNALKARADSQVKKAQEQIDAQKKQAEAQIEQAKGDANRQADQAKKKAEEDAKKQVNKEAQKKLDELKKKLKF